DSADYLRRNLAPALPPGHFASYAYPDLARLGCDDATHASVATSLIHHAYQAVSPDAVIYTTPFEGWGEHGVVPLPGGDVPSAIRATVLYDFIPWLFPDQYLDRVPSYRQWYERRLAALHRFDLLLAISEATRQDAIKILGIAPERVVNISGAAGEIFRPMPEAEQQRIDTARFGITRPFVLYTGNADYRKNLTGMVEAYARLPMALRKGHQLVLNQVGSDVAAFRKRVHALGLTDDDVVITGHITDEELICLYTQCKVFVFPSLYEGFGLPILEAMACGAPVIAANNSSIPEVAGREDILFDASNPASIAASLQEVLANDSRRKELSAYSIDRAKFFSWDRCAKLTWEAIEACHAERQAVPARHLLPHLPKPRIAVVCPLTSADTPAAQHCIASLPQLARHFDIDIFIEEGTKADVPVLSTAFPVYPHTRLADRRDKYAALVYQLADLASHAYMLPLLEQFPGVVVTHDTVLDAAVQALGRRTGMSGATEKRIIHTHGLQGLISLLKQHDATLVPQMDRGVLESASQLILPHGVPTHGLQHATGAWLPSGTALPPGGPVDWIPAYAQAIHAGIAADELQTVKRVADALDEAAPTEQMLNAISHHAANNLRVRRQPRLLLDVTQLARTDAHSGIQRVVKKIASEIGTMHAGDMPLPIDLVRLKDGKLWRASGVIANIFGVNQANVPEEEVHVHPGDTLLMIDSSWEQYAEFVPVFNAVRAFGGKIITIVYDLIPLRMPHLCLAALVNVFRQWFPLAAEQSDMLLCISRSVANDVAAYLAEHPIDAEKMPAIAHWHLGADIGSGHGADTVRPLVKQLTEGQQSPMFLVVGTVEPRKGHDFILDAFEELWKSGVDMRLCIAGQEGWNVADTMRRIRTHPLLNEKLFLIEKFTDAEINLCYASATALIAASTAEGFGLPIVEAALHHIPVLASDIPVFREVGGEGATYFSLESPAHLAHAVKAMSHNSAEERLAMAANIKTLTWRQSATELLEKIGFHTP
ncbi:MAG TPA: glycosyltransferase family 1 protein, partial [Noviherbaspirillum sp.]